MKAPITAKERGTIMSINEATPEEWEQASRKVYEMDKVYKILTEDFQVTVVREFCKLHAEIAEDEAAREACSVLMGYCKPVTG